MSADVRARRMPMKVFGLEVERKNVGQQYREGATDVADCVCAEIGRSRERGIATLQCRAHLYASIFGAAVRRNSVRRVDGSPNRLVVWAVRPVCPAVGTPILPNPSKEVR